MARAGQAEHAAERAQGRVECGGLRDQGAHGGIGENLFEGGAVGQADIGDCRGCGDEAEQPGAMAGHGIGPVGAGRFGAGRARTIGAGRFGGCKRGGLGGAEQKLEFGGHAGEAARNGMEQGGGQADLIPAPDDGVAQAAHEGGEAVRKTNGVGLIGHGCIRARRGVGAKGKSLGR